MPTQVELQQAELRAEIETLTQAYSALLSKPPAETRKSRAEIQFKIRMAQMELARLDPVEDEAQTFPGRIEGVRKSRIADHEY